MRSGGRRGGNEGIEAESDGEVGRADGRAGWAGAKERGATTSETEKAQEEDMDEKGDGEKGVGMVAGVL